jgi:hypothetical protein
VTVPWPRRFLKARCSFSERFSNIGTSQVYQPVKRAAPGVEPAWNARDLFPEKYSASQNICIYIY